PRRFRRAGRRRGKNLQLNKRQQKYGKKTMSEKIEYDFKSGGEHPYHIVRPSIWPFFGAFAAFLLAMGGVLYMHESTLFGVPVGLNGVFLGLASVLAVMFFWWWDVIVEAVEEKAHTPVARIGMRYGMSLFIASEVMFFFAFFWAFFNASLFPTAAIGGIWPPETIEPIPAFGLPFLMTMILLLSACTVTWAHHAIIEGDNDNAVRGLLYTVLLGIVFTGFQAYEYIHASFGFSENVYSSAFYMATGFHGFHVLIGTIFLGVCYFRAKKKHFTPES